MLTVRARVQNGRLVVDEPTDLPEGTEVELVPVDDVETLDDSERERLFGFLEASIRRHEPGKGVAADDVLSEIRSRR